jgi:hypothetical protein
MYPAEMMGRAGIELWDVTRARTTTHRRLRDRLVGIGVMTVAIDLVCAVLALLFEQHGAQSQIKTFGSALFWTSTQLLTVSSSLQDPVTTAGRVLDVLMEIYAVSVVASISGSLGAFLIRRGHEMDGPPQGPKP